MDFYNDGRARAPGRDTNPMQERMVGGSPSGFQTHGSRRVRVGTAEIIAYDQGAVQLDPSVNEFFAKCPNGLLWRARRASPWVFVRLCADRAPPRRVPEAEFDANWGGLGD